MSFINRRRNSLKYLLAMGFSLALFLFLPNIAHPASANLIVNPSVETANSANAALPASWSANKWGTNDATLSYQSGAAHSGNMSLYASMSTHTSGDAKWSFSPVNITSGDSYTFSDYYQSNTPTELDAMYTSTTGIVSYAYLKTVPANSSWSQVVTSFTAPANATSVSIVHILYNVGYLQTDDYSLVDNNSNPAPPQVSIASPTDGSTISGNQTISANASDTLGISSVQFKLDGNNIGTPVTSAPYSYAWDSSAVADGTHTIAAVATDTAGLSTTSASVTVTVQNQTPPPPSNLVANPSAETVNPANNNLPLYWKASNWGTNSTTLTYQDGGHSGNKSLFINMASRTSGDAKWIFDPVSVTPGSTYSFSDYYQSNVTTELDAQYTDANGSVSYLYLKQLPGSPSWTQASALFTVPANIVKVSVLQIIYSPGWLQTDDYSLVVKPNPSPPQVSIITPANNANLTGIQSITASATDSSGITSVQFTLDGNNLGPAITSSPYGYDWDTAKTSNGPHTLTAVATNSAGLSTTSAPVSVSVQNQAPPANLVPNPSVETVSATNPNLPQSWNKGSWGTNTTAFTYVGNGANTGSHSLMEQMSSYTNGAAYWYFQAQPVAPNQQYDFKDYYKSNLIAEVDAVFNLSDGTTQYVNLGNSFPSSTDWTKFERQFTTPSNVVSMTIRHTLYNVGWLQTDDYSITKYQTVGFSRPIVSLTFDDGWASFFNNGLPELKKYGLTSTDFIVSSYLGTSGYMSTRQVQQLYAAGNEIGSHTVDHRDLTTLNASDLNSELQNSQTFLQNLISSSVNDFASPFGSYNQTVINNTKLYYQSHRSVESGFNAKSNFDAYDIKVQNMYSTTTLAQFQSWVDQAKATNTWLVLVYHKVDPTIAKSADKYNTYTSDLDAQFAYLKNSGVPVETIAQALAETTSQIGP